MMTAPNVPKAIRAVALWLLVMCVCFGPGTFGASAALAVATACEGACPCAVTEPSEPCADEHAADERAANDQSADAGYEATNPSHGDCSDTCPTCACRLGAALAVLDLPRTAPATSWSLTSLVTPIDTVTLAPRTRVFRPPRVLA